MPKLYSRPSFQAATSVAVDWDIPVNETVDCAELSLVWDSAPAANENVVVTLDSVRGAAYDRTIVKIDPAGATTLRITGINGLVYGDQINVAYTNTGTDSITGEVTFDSSESNAGGSLECYLDGVKVSSAGSVGTQEYAASAIAIDDDWAPAFAFKLIDVVINFDSAPTTSENVVIKSITPGTVTIVEDTFDPSLSTAVSHPRRFDKEFAAGTVIGIDYTNTDTRDIVRVIRYKKL